MRRVLARLSDGTTVQSVVAENGGMPRHLYRLVGGRHDGREFTTLTDLNRYLRESGEVVG